MTEDNWVRDQLEIRALIEHYSDACCRRDSAAILDLWAEDCLWSVPDMAGLERIEGKPAIKQMWEGAQQLFPFAFLICVPGDIKIDRETATARSYTTEVLKDQDGKLRQTVGRYDDKCGRRNGKWLFTERIWHMLHHL
jgi:ketosteroid isomerase-like protein